MILDPFVGSGSTAIACFQLNRRYLGFEVEEKYCNISMERISRVLASNKKIMTNNLSNYKEIKR